MLHLVCQNAAWVTLFLPKWACCHSESDLQEKNTFLLSRVSNDYSRHNFLLPMFRTYFNFLTSVRKLLLGMNLCVDRDLQGCALQLFSKFIFSTNSWLRKLGRLPCVPAPTWNCKSTKAITQKRRWSWSYAAQNVIRSLEMNLNERKWTCGECKDMMRMISPAAFTATLLHNLLHNLRQNSVYGCLPWRWRG